MDLLLPPVRAGGHVAFQLVVFHYLVSHDPFAIFALFVFWVCVAVSTSKPAVATASSAVATAVASTPDTEGSEKFGDLGRSRRALLFERGDQRVVASSGGSGGNDFGGWRGGGRSGGCGDCGGVLLVLESRILALQ